METPETIRPLSPPPAPRLVPRNIDSVKADIHEMVDGLLEDCLEQGRDGASTAELERSVGAVTVAAAQRMVAFVFARACQDLFIEDIKQRGLGRRDVQIRTDKGGYASVNTTFGPITFPTFAYRDLTSPLGSVTRRPAAKLFPYHRLSRSTPLCLEWEARLGAQHPFRKAEELFHFFSRGTSTVEDTTISRHILALSSMVEPEWLYRKPEEVRQILAEKATRDKWTGRPLLYMSSDAHALRRYVGATWATNWKMVNGIRLWCEDAATGEIIHIGGEFTWGDCREVGARIKGLIEAGILPGDDTAWAQVDPLIVFISDGAEWLVDHIIMPHLASSVAIVDVYHVLEWIGDFAAIAFGKGTAKAKQLYARAYEVLLGPRPEKPKAGAKKRRGHTKTRGGRRRHAHDHHKHKARPSLAQPGAITDALYKLLAEVPVRTGTKKEEALEALAERLANNTFRMDYEEYLERGMQLGSGAMESMHRSGSQRRLKLPGAWTEETSLAVLNFRMLELAGRWDEFWNRSNIVPLIDGAFREAKAGVFKNAA